MKRQEHVSSVASSSTEGIYTYLPTYLVPTFKVTAGLGKRNMLRVG